MAQSDQAGKSQGKKLGRGLSALLGSPVHIRIPKEAETPQAKASEIPIVSVSSSMQEAVAKEPRVPAPVRAMDRGFVGLSEPANPTSSAAARPAESSNSPTGELREIPVEQIQPNPRQPRTDFDPSSIETLAASIRQAGLMQPIMVRPTARGFELVAGERRWRAAKLLGLRVIPAIVRSLSDEASAELAIIENIHREDLNPMDRALALRRLSEDFSLTHQELADRVGLDRTSVSNLLRLGDLDPATADLVRKGSLSQSHGKALLAIEDLARRSELAQRAVQQGWSVRELERKVQQSNDVKPVIADTSASSAGEPSPRSANIADLERQLAEHLGTRVSLQLGRKKGSGRLVLDFYSLDQFDGLMARLGFRPGRS